MVQIFMIPVGEAFDACRGKIECGCPICRLYRQLQRDELDIILGASMMEPDIRIKTNELGFCADHYAGMLVRKRMLGMGLILESHLAETEKKITARSLLKDPSAASIKAIGKLNRDCYVCSRIEKNLAGMISTVVYMYETDDEFVKKFRDQPYFCLPHYEAMMTYAQKKMKPKLFREFFDDAQKIETEYVKTLENDVSWFCKKFDYNYEEEPWYNSKDSVQRSIKFLSGDKTDEQ